MIILVIIKAKDYIEKRRNLLHQLKLYADIDFSGNILHKKIQAAT